MTAVALAAFWVVALVAQWKAQELRVQLLTIEIGSTSKGTLMVLSST